MENIAGGHYDEVLPAPPNEDRLLDPKNLVDKEVLQYIHQIQNGTAPSQSEQRNIVKSIHQNDKAAKIDLINLNRGLISAIAHALNTLNFDTSVETIPAGAVALLKAATTYDLKISKISFTNYAIPQIHQAMEEVAYSVELPYIFDEETPPLYTIYKYLSTLKKKPAPTPENSEIENTATQIEDDVLIIDEQINEDGVLIEGEKILSLTTTEIGVIPYLHLPKSDIMRITGMRNMTIQMVINRLARRTQTANLQALALYLYTEGFIHTIPAPNTPFEKVFHPRQIEVLQNLQLTKNELAAKFSLPEDSIIPFIRDALIVTGAKTKTELLLMAHIYGQKNDLINDQRDENAS